MKPKRITRSLPCRVPEKTFALDSRYDMPNFFVFNSTQDSNIEFEMEKLSSFSSSFVDLYALYHTKYNNVIGYSVIVKRGTVQNLGVSLLISKAQLRNKAKVVEVSVSHDLIKLGNLLRIIKLGDSAIFIGVPNNSSPFFA